MENAAETPNILDRGMLRLKEQIKYQKNSDKTEAPPAAVVPANGSANGAKAIAAEPKAAPRTAYIR